MKVTRSVIDLDDAESLIAADRDGLLRAASGSGAQVRATAAAVDEGALASIAGPAPRSVIWVAGRGTAATAGRMVGALLYDAAGTPIVLASGAPPWLGPLDVVVLAGDDPGDPALTAAASTAARRGARVVVVAPFEGPLGDAAAGRAAVLEPRLPGNAAFGLCRYVAAGLAVVAAVDGGLRADIGALADQIDAEVLRSSATRELFTNPAKALTERMLGRRVVFAADAAVTLALAHHASATMLRVAGEAVAATGLADAAAEVSNSSGAGNDSIFHDEQIDGPLPERLRVLALSLHAERQVVAVRTSGLDDVHLVGAEDVADPTAIGIGGAEQELTILAVRLEMAAVYLRLVRG